MKSLIAILVSAAMVSACGSAQRVPDASLTRRCQQANSPAITDLVPGTDTYVVYACRNVEMSCRKGNVSSTFAMSEGERKYVGEDCYPSESFPVPTI